MTRRRLTGVVLVATVVVIGGVACSSGSSPDAAAPATPEVFGPAGYRGLTLGMAKDAALAGGKLATAPTSTLDGCADFSYTGGPAPDPVRMKAEADAETKAKELNKKADELQADPEPKPGASAEESAKAAEKSAADTRLFADAAQASADLAGKREERDKAFVAAGGASFGKDGLRELAAPPGAKTAEGVGAGSSPAELKAAYDAKGLKAGDNGRFQMPVDGKPGWVFEFTVNGDKVGSVSMIDPKAKCS
ncbi:hypothetical protein ACFORH_13070 [Amycolatopsis roodepoortensis]|uniref:Lipoprotein n=1 Tax=Amycolatopsis roodepoortensis TaxID=700274 RepID=A0ABR9KYT0_9PSEU|nr:hypothetical protein [Amycolatopsis roodepoortensis]MBE1573270.1 hypothetical protein [Amycolatopsis roodepoortensis]